MQFNDSVQYSYFAVDVDDLDYEYAITGSVGQPYIAYMDIGTNGGGSPAEGTIKNLDFVTANGSSLTKINDSGYTPSNSLFSINGSSSLETNYYFRRINDTVLYYISPTTSGLVITEIGDGNKKKATDENCNS